MDGAEHGVEGDARVDGQEDVVQNDEELEGSRRADPPWLVSSAAVICVDQEDGDNISRSDRRRHLDVQRRIEQLAINWEGRPPRPLVARGREGSRQVIRRELEQRAIGHPEV